MIGTEYTAKKHKTYLLNEIKEHLHGINDSTKLPPKPCCIIAVQIFPKRYKCKIKHILNASFKNLKL